jgi:PERQ amino acid-rich with GYF domain-containing protein
MQKWYEGGYFTPDLLMKRTHTDNEWIPVGELAHRVGGGKIFLTLPTASTVPPGLSRHPEQPPQVFSSSHDHNAYNTPYQPVPTRSLRTSALDPYLSSTFNSADSPSSSFGARRFSNGSPDPAVFGSRMVGNMYAADAISARMSGFAAPGPSFAAFNEPPLDQSLRAGGFGNVATGRASSVDNFGFNGGYISNQAPWQSNPINPTAPGFDGMTAGLTTDPLVAFPSDFDHTRPSFNIGSSTYLNQSGGLGNDRGPQDVYVDNNTGSAGSATPQMAGSAGNDNSASNEGFGSHANGLGNVPFGDHHHQSYSQSPALQYAATSQHSAISLRTNTLPTNNQPTNAPPQSPWANVEPISTRRLGPFDASHPKTTNTVIKQTATPSQPPAPWGPSATSPHPSQTNEASPWYAASQAGAADGGWRETPGPNSLTFDNVGAHNQRHEILAGDAPTPAAETPADIQSELPAQPIAEPVSSVAPAVLQPPVVPKSKRKTAAQQNQTVTPAMKTQTPLPSVTKEPSPPAPNKPAWSTEEDTKRTKPSSASLGLREIQEAEAKRLEARKAVERERAARAAISTSPTIEDAQPFTASWGLLTSRAGARIDISPKEGPTTNASSATIPNTPVWTNNGKPQQAKRTMKEIQEEEERRKALAMKETTAAAAAARRGYADTTNKVSPSEGLTPEAAHFLSQSASLVQPGGSAWTTVGAAGKTSVAPMGAVRPSTTSSLSASSSQSAVRTNGPASLRQISASKPAPTPRVDEPAAPPSHDFLKWLGDSLKGLNSSVDCALSHCSFHTSF